MTSASSQPPVRFPPERADRTRAPAFLFQRGLKLRWMRDTDLPWLRDLYASTRAEEMRPIPWTAQEKRLFLDQQFALQHEHFVSHFGDADFLAIEREGGKPVGRYYVVRGEPMHIVDIALLPEQRSRGIGSALIEHSLAEARENKRSMLLHVVKANHRAARLYERLGFVVEADAESHWTMRWSPRATPSK